MHGNLDVGICSLQHSVILGTLVPKAAFKELRDTRFDVLALSDGFLQKLDLVRLAVALPESMSVLVFYIGCSSQLPQW